MAIAGDLRGSWRDRNATPRAAEEAGKGAGACRRTCAVHCPGWAAAGLADVGHALMNCPGAERASGKRTRSGCEPSALSHTVDMDER